MTASKIAIVLIILGLYGLFCLIMLGSLRAKVKQFFILIKEKTVGRIKNYKDKKDQKNAYLKIEDFRKNQGKDFNLNTFLNELNTEIRNKVVEEAPKSKALSCSEGRHRWVKTLGGTGIRKTGKPGYEAKVEVYCYIETCPRCKQRRGWSTDGQTKLAVDAEYLDGVILVGKNRINYKQAE